MNDQSNRLKSYAFGILSIALSVFVLVAANTTLIDQQPSLALFGMLGLLLVFIDRPAVKRWKDSLPLKLFDALLMLAAIVCFGYIFVQSEKLLHAFWIDGTLLGDRAGIEKPFEFVIAAVGLLLVLEATRRSIGWTLPVLCGLFVLYAHFGQQMPDWLFPHRGVEWKQIAQKTFLQSGGIFGVALKVMFTYVFLFVLFGTMLEQTGATGYVIRFARTMFRSSSGGPAKVAVISSGLMGSLSGSAVANTATTGTFTIPLMKSTGFDADTAAGVEAAASSGGALMPPIMGAGAYMMLEMVESSYLEIIRAALIPAILYYTALLLTVHFYANRIGATAESEVDTEQETQVHAYQGFVFFGSFLILLVSLLMGYTAFRSVSIALVGILILSMFQKSTRIDGTKLYAAVVNAAKSGVALIVAASCVGIIIAMVGQTPLGGSLPVKIQAIAGDYSLLALLMLMFSTIILGMGLPSAVCYLLMATLIGSVLDTLDTPPLAAHLFIFYFGMMSMVTPPVALAAYAASAIAEGNIMKSAFAAFRFALVGFALPFAFVLKPELLMLTTEGAAANPFMVAAVVSVSLAGTLGLSSSIAGFAFSKLGFASRSVLLVLSLIVFLTRWQDWQLVAQLVAAGAIVSIVFWNWKTSSRTVNDSISTTTPPKAN